MKKILLASLILLLLTGCIKENDKEESKIIENDGMLSYTIDGEKTDIKPTKEDGYIVNKIICDNGSDLMWDNDNWEVELTGVKSKDTCIVDFTKDISKEGYRITVTSNSTSSLDSLSKATTLNGTVIIYSTSKIESVTGCDGVIEDNKVIVRDIISNQICNLAVEQTLADAIKVAYKVDDNRKRTDFSAIDNGTHPDTPIGLTGGLYTAEDDQGTTYYFSGDGSSMNNWVLFAGSLWRIIRINGNGSVRLLYAGSGGEDGYIGSPQPYNNSTNHPAYVGLYYSIGESLDEDRNIDMYSEAASTIGNWYFGLFFGDLVLADLADYIDTNAIYCNDRNVASGYEYSKTNYFEYAAYERLIVNKKPIFKCNDNRDKITGSNEAPVGLMTADEVAYAGGLYGSNNLKAYYYLNANGGSATGSNMWWTMTPSYYSFFGIDYVAGEEGVIESTVFLYSIHNSRLTLESVDQNAVIRPVISLKKELLVTGGNGSANDPYTVSFKPLF